MCRATGSRVQTSVNGITDDVLGTCDDFEERQVGDERYNIFTGCPQRHTSTIVLRGGAEQFLEESHRSIWGMLRNIFDMPILLCMVNIKSIHHFMLHA